MLKTFLVTVSLLATSVPCALAQSEDEIRSLRRDLDAIRDSQKVIKDQLDAIQKLLQQGGAPGAQPQAFKEATLNIDGAYSIGDKKAPVTMVEFTDYQCPFCSRNFKDTFPQLNSEYIKTGKVRYVLVEFPLESIHPFAFKAAEAARCSGEQGKYWEMHDELFSHQDKLAADDLARHAGTVGIDVDKFKACLSSGKEATKIRSEMAEGSKNGISGTPGFFLGLTTPNNQGSVKATKQIIGAQPYSQFKDAIDSLLADAK